MRFMIIVKASKDSEAGKLPSQELLAAMASTTRSWSGRHHAQRRRAAAEQQGRACASRRPAHCRRRPFTETKELIAGYWIWQVKSKAEAIEWVKRCPNPMPARAESRSAVFEAEDFGAEFTPELREQEDRLRAQLARSAERRHRWGGASPERVGRANAESAYDFLSDPANFPKWHPGWAR